MDIQSQIEPYSKSFAPNGIDAVRDRISSTMLNKKNLSGIWDAWKDTLYLVPPYLGMMLVVELSMNYMLFPAINRFLQRVSGNPEAKMPEISQSIFRAVNLFVWFGAIHAKQSFKTSIQYEKEHISPNVKSYLLTSSLACYQQDDSRNKANSDEFTTSNVSDTDASYRVAEDAIDNSADVSEASRNLAIRLSRTERELNLLKQHLSNNVAYLMEVAEPNYSQGFSERLFAEEKPDLETIQSNLNTVIAILYGGTKPSIDGRSIAFSDKDKNEILGEIYFYLKARNNGNEPDAGKTIPYNDLLDLARRSVALIHGKIKSMTANAGPNMNVISAIESCAARINLADAISAKNSRSMAAGA